MNVKSTEFLDRHGFGARRPFYLTQIPLAQVNFAHQRLCRLGPFRIPLEPRHRLRELLVHPGLLGIVGPVPVKVAPAG